MASNYWKLHPSHRQPRGSQSSHDLLFPYQLPMYQMYCEMLWGLYQTTFSSSTYMLINLGVWLCPCTAGIICCFAALNYPPEFNIKNRAGENVGCITGDIDRQTQKHHKHDNGNHSKPTIMHFRDMTLEQRRLGLVAALHYMSASWRGDM